MIGHTQKIFDIWVNKSRNWLAVADINPVCKQIAFTTHTIYASYKLTSKLVWNVSVSSFDSTMYLNIIINRIEINNKTFYIL